MSLVYPGSEKVAPNIMHPPGSRPLVRPEPIIKVDDLAYLLWEVADIQQQRNFLLDFGMLDIEQGPECIDRNKDQLTNSNLIMRGYGTFPYLYVGRKAKKNKFLGTGFMAASRDDLHRLAEHCGRPIEPLERIGGGEVVRLTDPNGLLVEVCYGIELVESTPTRENPLDVNTPFKKTRINQAQRPPLAASPVLRLGHCVTAANNMQEVCTWYMQHLGLIPSDVMCLDDGSPMIAFMRLDRGEQPADHHCFVVGKGAGEGYLHSAYEVVDVDAIGQGQQYLKSKDYTHVWGIGRHLLGSQLFDYWQDPSGHEFEHYADGDVYTQESPTCYHPMHSGHVYAWGQDMPKSMLRPNFRQLLTLVGGLLSGALTFRWLRTAMRAANQPARPWL